MRSSIVWEESNDLPMSGSATLATDRFRLATAATRMSETSTVLPFGGVPEEASAPGRAGADGVPVGADIGPSSCSARTLAPDGPGTASIAGSVAVPVEPGDPSGESLSVAAITYPSQASRDDLTRFWASRTSRPTAPWPRSPRRRTVKGVVVTSRSLPQEASTASPASFLGSGSSQPRRRARNRNVKPTANAIRVAGQIVRSNAWSQMM